VNSIPGKGGAPHIVNVSFEGIRSEVLLHALEDKGVYVSSGSACASNHPGLSHVLLAAGIPKQRIEGTLRFSLDTETTREEIDAALAAVAEAVPFYRRLRRR
jgi:cysteine desulfurase